MKPEETNDQSRRNFIITAAVAAAAVATCGSLACSCSSKKHQHTSGEKVKLLSQNGEIIEIDLILLLINCFT